MTDCPICERGQPLDLLADHAFTWVTTDGDRRDERRAFWDDVTLASEHLANLVRPDKINIELHGNTIRHLHAHVFAREPAIDTPLDALTSALA